MQERKKIWKRIGYESLLGLPGWDGGCGMMVYNPDEVEKDYTEEDIIILMKGGIEEWKKRNF